VKTDTIRDTDTEHNTAQTQTRRHK